MFYRKREPSGKPIEKLTLRNGLRIEVGRDPPVPPFEVVPFGLEHGQEILEELATFFVAAVYRWQILEIRIAREVQTHEPHCRTSVPIALQLDFQPQITAFHA